MDVSIIIVNYNTKDYLYNCLHSIYKNTKDISFEILVSDNGSTDGSIEMLQENFPNVILIQNNNNLGFGKANNIALKYAKGTFIFYLNSDTVLLNNVIKIFFDFWLQNENNIKIGVIGANMIDINGNITQSYNSFPTLKKDVLSLLHCNYMSIFPFYRIRKNPIEERIGPVDFVKGADMFMKNSEYSFFDEKYFMYYEETDLQRKMCKMGFVNFLIDGPRIKHFEGASEIKKTFTYSFNKKTSNYYWTSSVIYHKQYGNKILWHIYRGLIILTYLLPWNIKTNFKNISILMEQ